MDASHIHLPDSPTTPRVVHWVRVTSSSLSALGNEPIASELATESSQPSGLAILFAQWLRPKPFLQDFGPTTGLAAEAGGTVVVG